MNLGLFWSNWIVWIIIALGMMIYYLLIYHILRLKAGEASEEVHQWLGTMATLISALPLLGLLGTISGLLETFFLMSRGQGLDQSDLLTSGIADALITTQCGLAMAVPAWLLLAWTRRLAQRAQGERRSEVKGGNHAA